MRFRHWSIAGVLVLLMALAVVGLLRTREEKPPAEGENPGKAPSTVLSRNIAAAPRSLVDERPLQTARTMAAMATPEEQTLAQAAVKVGDHEVDLAFYDALRTAEENPPQLTPAAKPIADRKNKATLALQDDQERIAQLTRQLAAAPEAKKENVQDQIDVAKAQQDLDQYEVDDAAAELEQAGGDSQSKIKRLKAEHDASDQNQTRIGSAVNPLELDYRTRTLLSVFRAWKALGEKEAALGAARQEASAKAQRLSQRHDVLAAQVEREKENREAAKQNAKSFSQTGKTTSREDSKSGAQAAVDSLKQYTRDQKNLADLGRRNQDQKELGDIYVSWIALVEARRRTALHHLIAGLLWILLVVLLVYLARRLIDRQFAGIAAENKRIETLRSVVKFAVGLVGAIVILFIVIGMPSQATTILGLAGAGLTVASKDVIMAFFGWFLLMGRNGIRVGDWVEINGVAGEVVEIGLLKTILLETGNWTDAGHPTGRRVSFVNSFAIEGHFFNFTTSGQWMWDELQLSIPGDQNPYGVIDGLQKLVTQETEENAHKAEAEWSESTTHYRVKSFSAEPAISVKPSGSGVEVKVRYITRAYDRHETRKKLYGAVVELMHGKRETVKQ